MIGRFAIGAAWLDTRLAMRLTAEGLTARRERLWAAMRPVIGRTPALRDHVGKAIADIPVTDPSVMRRDLTAWNSAGITVQEALEAAGRAEDGGDGLIRDDIAAGLSTGTSGERGLFLADAAERARYVGQSVARIMPVHAPITGARIALVLRADSELYRDAGGGRFAFAHIPLGLDADEMAERLRRFRPTILIAPPRELASLARIEPKLPTLRRILWGSEPMAARERTWIASMLGQRPDPIYQATEGFIAAPCQRGVLHLNDDSMDIGLEPVPGIDAFRPIVTDLRRHVQPMVRVRMDDVVRLDPKPCTCGFAGRVIVTVSGRVQDIWHAPGGAMLPDEIDDMLVEGVGEAARWRVVGSPTGILLQIDDASKVDRAQKVLNRIMEGIPVEVRIAHDGDGFKRRRVTWSPSV